MARLTKSIQTFVVEELAAYRTPSEVAKDVKEEFGVDVDRQQVEYYDPTKGQKPAKKWRELFRKVREAIQDNSADRGIKHVGYRIAEYQRMYRKAIAMKNIPLAMEVLEQAAKDLGGKFTNTKNLVHSGSIDVTELSDEQVERLAEGEPAEEVLQ